ncbi:hypothetical protein [Streptomyces sp. MAI_2237]
MLTAAGHPDLVRGLVLVEAGPGRADPDVPAEVGRWLGAWPVPFPSLEAAAAFLGGGPVGEGWAAGLEERGGAWWPRFDRDVMVDSLTENTQRSYWDEWTTLTARRWSCSARPASSLRRSAAGASQRKLASSTATV